MAYKNQVDFPDIARAAGSGIIGPTEHHQGIHTVLCVLQLDNANLGNVNVQFQMLDSNTGNWAILAQTANFNAAATKVIMFSAISTGASSNVVSFNVPIPTEFRLVVAEDNTAKTYGFSYELLGAGISGGSF